MCARLPDRWKKRLIYFFCAGLLIGYVAVAGIAFMPNVSPAYEGYYIDETMDEWPGVNGFEYQLGDRIYFGSADQPAGALDATGRLSGWYGIERWGRWVAGERGSVYMRLQPPVEHRLTLSVAARGVSENRTRSVSVLVNGERVGTITATVGETSTYHVQIPAAVAQNTSTDHLLEITFVVQNPVSPAQLGPSDDTRQLGFGVVWLELDTIVSVRSPERYPLSRSGRNLFKSYDRHYSRGQQ